MQGMVPRPRPTVPGLPVHDSMLPVVSMPTTAAIHANPFAAGQIGRAIHNAVASATHTGTPPIQLGQTLRGILSAIQGK